MHVCKVGWNALFFFASCGKVGGMKKVLCLLFLFLLGRKQNVENKETPTFQKINAPQRRYSEIISIKSQKMFLNFLSHRPSQRQV